MHEQGQTSGKPLTVQRHCDVAIVGGSAAGLAAALQLARQDRSVIVVDSGDPRNAPAAHMHGYLGYEAAPPSELIGAGRDEVRRYGGEVLAGNVLSVHGDRDHGFVLELTGGHRVLARRVLAASGLVDELPDIDGLSELWGGDVIHCPFCHGYEARDRSIVQVVTHPMGLHPTVLFAHLTDSMVVVLHDAVEVSADRIQELRSRGLDVRRGVVVSVGGDNGQVHTVELADGSRLEADVVVISPTFHVRAEPFASLGLEPAPHPSGLGSVIETDAMGQSAVPGLYAAGNVTDPSQQVLHAAADGSRTAAMIAFDLAEEDLTLAGAAVGSPGASKVPANESDWDHRYSGERLWSGNPNGTLVAEASQLEPASALDVGAGEGGDAIWLAENGWTVTANDVSARGLERVAAHADERGVELDLIHSDAGGVAPFGDRRFDLVCAQYASIPRSPDRRAIHNLLDAVAPGGRLLVVGHDPAAMRAPIDTSQHSRPFDADAYVQAPHVAEVIAGDPRWEIEVDELRPRPVGAASTHHVDDVVLRARRVET